MSVKHKIICMLFCIIAPMAVIYLLYAFSPQPNQRKNGFSRRFSGWRAIPLDTLAAEKKFLSVCGVTDYGLYVQLHDKQAVLWTDWFLAQKVTYILPLPPDQKIRSRIQVQIDSPLYHIFAGNGPDIFRGNLVAGGSSQHFHYNWPVFLQGIAIPGGRYLLHGFDNRGTGFHQPFILWDPLTGKQLKKYDPFPGTADAGIGSDGLMSYDTASGRLVFLQFYRNGLLSLDSTLAPLSEGATIDTVRSGTMQFAGYSDDEQFEYAGHSPLALVNGQLCLDNGKIYVNSMLKADNEENGDWSFIDVYDLRTLHYLYSFHLPWMEGKRIISFRVLHDKLAAVYSGGLVTYRLEH